VTGAAGGTVRAGLCGFLLLAVAAGAAGQEGTDRFHGQVGAAFVRFDNFLQKDGESLDVNAARLDGRFAWRLGPGRLGLSTHLAVSQLNYDRFAPSKKGLWGLGWDRRPHSLRAEIGYSWDTPQFYIKDELDTRRVLGVDTRYGYRINRNHEVRGRAAWHREEFQILHAKDNQTWMAGASYRYRGWGRKLSPEIGLLYTWQNASLRNYDYKQRDLILQLRSAPARPFYITFRYRFRVREYATGEDTDSNFGREDDRHQFRFQTLWTASDHLVWDFYAASEDVDSAKPGSSIQTKVFALGVKFLF